MRVRVKIEIPHGSVVKYEYDKTAEVMRVDRILDRAIPYNYGFMPKTLWLDGDPLDVILLGDFVLHPGVELDAKVVGLIRMHDNGESDYKLVCALGDEKFEDSKKWIVAYLKSYKTGVVIRGTTTDQEELETVIEKACRRYGELHGHEFTR